MQAVRDESCYEQWENLPTTTNEFSWIPAVFEASKQTESKTSNEQMPEQVMGVFHNL